MAHFLFRFHYRLYEYASIFGYRCECNIYATTKVITRIDMYRKLAGKGAKLLDLLPRQLTLGLATTVPYICTVFVKQTYG